ncbi:MAG TPA: hypothetical protein VJR04_13690 [Terriglobales bacterium]|nr:hypothetical protein [Terriglobales bacterium]
MIIVILSVEKVFQSWPGLIGLLELELQPESGQNPAHFGEAKLCGSTILQGSQSGSADARFLGQLRLCPPLGSATGSDVIS